MKINWSKLVTYNCKYFIGAEHAPQRRLRPERLQLAADDQHRRSGVAGNVLGRDPVARVGPLATNTRIASKKCFWDNCNLNWGTATYELKKINSS